MNSPHLYKGLGGALRGRVPIIERAKETDLHRSIVLRHPRNG
jgi:hypothetical protein